MWNGNTQFSADKNKLEAGSSKEKEEEINKSGLLLESKSPYIFVKGLRIVVQSN